jgi:hypothetical protein
MTTVAMDDTVCECDAMSEDPDCTNPECLERRAVAVQDAMREDFYDDPDYD